MIARLRTGGRGFAGVAAVLALGGGLATASPSGAASSNGVALQVVSESPASNSLDANGAGAIVVTFDQVLSPNGADPTITPPVAGTWVRSRTELVFRPTVAMPPQTLEKVVVPDGRRGVTARDGARLRTPIVFQFATRSGSVLRAEQILATLGYLPLRFIARAHARLDAAAAARAVYLAPRGTFVWRWGPPRALAALWSPGHTGPMLTGAVTSFERDRGDPLDGQLGGTVWSQLLAASLSPREDLNRSGYTYALASKADPETLVVFHNGVPVVQTDANTGIPAAPTPDGTYTVYARLASQVMKGVTPWGTSYADPVSWVAYFHGSDAIHYIGRSSFGYPQSLGCVEVPYSAAARAWPYLTIGSLVTVEG